MWACVVVSLPPPPPSPRMVQSWFIHKIVAEHKRRGLDSSRPVTRYIPGEKTRAALPSGRPESYLSLIRTCVSFLSLVMYHNNLTPDMDSVSSTCRTESPVGTFCQKTPEEEASSPASSSESNAKVWMQRLCWSHIPHAAPPPPPLPPFMSRLNSPFDVIHRMSALMLFISAVGGGGWTWLIRF